MANKKKIKLPLFIRSHEQIYFYIQELNRYRSSIPEKSKGNRDPFYSYLIGLSETEEITPELIEKVLELFKQIKSNAPRFHVTLADYPETEMRNKITGWFRRNIHPYSLVSFRYDRSLVGGIVVRGRNKIFDFSFRNKLQRAKLKPVDVLKNATK